MSMTQTQRNIAVELRKRCKASLVANRGIPDLLAMWTQESMGDLTDGDWSELPEFAGVTAAEATAARGALSTMNTTLGQYGAGTPSLYMLRLCDQVPNGG